MKKSKLVILRNAVILVLSLIMLVAGIGCLYADNLLNKINYVSPDDSSKVKTGSLFADDSAAGTGNEKAGTVGGLYHDDAITNILLLGVDDYQKNDSGRSDSMMLVSVDTRHQKLKVTSFLRDTYLAIPGIGSNKLTNAYSLGGGKVKGAKKIVSTIEANFGTDIDRFVIIDFNAFVKIIDRLGGVTITLTTKTDSRGRTEADLINLYSGDKNKVHNGVNNLSGKQARYYARIRAIGDDYGRTERQRKIFSSLVGKLKSSSITDIYGILADTLSLVTTNMTKGEVTSMASNSLTYLNYPVTQSRIPADGEYTPSDNVIIAGKKSDVLIPDLAKCKKTLADFIFENDIPSEVYDDTSASAAG